jgi:hypothetical protein
VYSLQKNQKHQEWLANPNFGHLTSFGEWEFCDRRRAKKKEVIAAQSFRFRAAGTNSRAL